LGYSHVASTQSTEGLKVVTRIDIEAKRGKELQDALRKSRRKYNIVAVRCLSKEVARIVARDERVDILLFPEDPTQRRQNWLDHHEAELLDGAGRAYEINASELLAASPMRLAKVITTIKRDLVVASRHNIPVVLSSGATSSILMREPRALTALATLLDIDEDYAADMLSTIPEAILARNHAEHEGEP
jgi:RNase P/RNase MRP subunit p30